MRYQFQIDNRAAGPVRERWEHAAQDCVAAGYGIWINESQIKTDDQATIARLESNDANLRHV